MALTHLVLIGAATAGTATAASLPAFLLWRLLTGLGLGGCLPNITALTAEISPRRIRARMLTVTGVGVSVGGVLGGFLIPSLIAAGGWRAPFLAAGGVTLLLALLLLAILPESPKFLALHRRASPAFANWVRRFGLGDPAALEVREAPAPRVPLLALFGPRFRLATVAFAGVYMINAVSVYMLTSWLPTVLPRAGFTLAQAARLAGTMQAGGIVGGLLLSAVLDRGRAVAALSAAYMCVLVALAAFSAVPAGVVGWGILLLIVGGGISGGHMALMAVGASLYPAAVLTSAIGFAVAVARIGAVGGPLAGQALVAGGVKAPVFLLAVTVPVALCLAGFLLLPLASRKINE